ncbi:hypothetical protein [Neisseria sp. 83E34]|uniref:hypothetical protein n=1 Tax=Neisseria sp. 83E34 TaxID=1692264 RepID=UPI0006CE8091|nr:hypothetical protein [Neisseria sp. 83E34]KPN71539.1 hypothetical protein AKG09_06690 [Neisseria sp. 83E34]
MMNRLKLLLPIVILHAIPMAVIWGVTLSMNLFPRPRDYLMVAYAAGGFLTSIYSLIWLVWNPKVNVRNYWLLNIGAWLFYSVVITVALYVWGGKMIAPDLGFLFGGMLALLWLPVSYVFWFRKGRKKIDGAWG